MGAASRADAAPPSCSMFSSSPRGRLCCLWSTTCRMSDRTPRRLWQHGILEKVGRLPSPPAAAQQG